MKNPYLITIQIPNNTQTDNILHFFRKACQNEGVLLKTVCFPSDGPLGQQIRVTTTNRLKFDPHTTKALALIDKMDYFFHTTADKEKTQNSPFTVFLVFQKTSNSTHDSNSSLNAWEKEINSILPQPVLTLDFCPTDILMTEDKEPYDEYYRDSETQNIVSLKEIEQQIRTAKKEANLNA